MTSTIEAADRVVGLARGMRDLVQAEAAESERARTLTPAIVDRMWATGLMSAFNPVEAGGVEPSFTEMIDTWIEMAWQDGSFGWVGIANLPSSFAAAAYLPDEGFAEVFTAHQNRVTMGGQFFPNGQGQACDGWLQVERVVELRLRNGPFGVRRCGFLSDGRRGDALDQRRCAGHAGGGGAARRDHLQRRVVCAGAQGNRVL